MIKELTLTTVISVRNELLSTDLSDTEVVMMQMDQGFYYGLEDVGKTIWESLDKPRSVNDLCEVVLQSYADAEREVVEPDVFAFLGELLEEELIEVQS